MILTLQRRYYAQATNGTLYTDGKRICHTIELPWKNNQRNVSCIPPGTYTLVKRYSQKFGWHLLVQHVPGRSLILLHPANNAMIELQGCIAPVTTCTSVGTGVLSKRAMLVLMQVVAGALAAEKTVLLIIGSAPARDRTGFKPSFMKQIINRAGSPTPPFFARLRNIGLALTALAAAVLTAPIALPALVSTVAGYVAVAGSIVGAVSQLVVQDEV